MIKHRLVHPFLLATYPIAALLAFNIDWLRPVEALRSWLLALLAALLLYLILNRGLRQPARAALLASLALVAFFSYGHLYEALKAAGLGASLGRHRYLAPLFVGLVGLTGWWLWRRARSPERATPILNLVGVAALAVPVFTLARWGAVSLSGVGPAPTASARLSLPADGRPPDIYYSIVDGYARADTLQRVFEFDNTPFLDFLEGRGFYIAADARSNYAQTGLSLASSLNLDYIDSLLPEASDGTGRESVWNLIRNNEVRRQLEAVGYEVVAFSTGLAGTEWTDADRYYTAGAIDEDLGLVGANPFESQLIQTSLLRLVSDGVVALPRFVPDVRYPYQVHRARIRHTFARLQDLPPGPRPMFVFAHIIAPHPPFVFAADGSPVTPDEPFTLRFTFDASDPSHDTYIRGYRDQTVYVNRELEAAVEAILARSTVPPVILIQGDHGPDSGSGRVSYTQERMTNLNALLVPGGSDLFHPGLTPVNSFRLVFSEVLGGDYPLLDDRVLYSQYADPYNFHDVTEAIEPP